MRRSMEVIDRTNREYERAGMSKEGIVLSAHIMTLVATLQATAIIAEVSPEFDDNLRELSEMSARAFAQYVKKYEKIDTSLLS